MKCLRPTYLGEFGLKGRDLRLKGQNRIGNLIVENRNYCEFEDWLNVRLRTLCTQGRVRTSSPANLLEFRRESFLDKPKPPLGVSQAIGLSGLCPFPLPPSFLPSLPPSLRNDAPSARCL